MFKLIVYCPVKQDVQAFVYHAKYANTAGINKSVNFTHLNFYK